VVRGASGLRLELAAGRAFGLTTGVDEDDQHNANVVESDPGTVMSLCRLQTRHKVSWAVPTRTFDGSVNHHDASLSTDSPATFQPLGV
jgi:hypothetical protein